MFERRVEGRVPRKHHLIHRDDEGALLHEECFTREGFEGPYTILYHRNRPHAHKRAEVKHGWKLPEMVQAQRWATKGLPIGLGSQTSHSAGPASALSWDQRVVQRAEAYQQCATHHLQLTGELQTDLQLLVAFAREQGIVKEESRAF